MPSYDPNLPLEVDVAANPDYLTDNSPDVQNISLAVYRKLAEAAPVSLDALADGLGMDAARISPILDTLPRSVLDFDDRGRIVAFIGLSIAPASHCIRVSGKTLYTWCVLDALFLPEILETGLTVKTRCPETGTEIAVHVTPEGVDSRDPPGIVMSVAAPDAKSCRADLRAAFCNHINFFKSEAAFREWARKMPGAGFVGLSKAFEMGTIRNRLRYPDIARFNQS